MPSKMVKPAFKPAKSPSEGVKEVYGDFVGFLYADHCDAYNTNVVKLEQALNAKREHIAYGLLSIVSIYMMVGSYAEFICNVIGFMYPAYASVKAIRTENTDDDTTWLIYWTIFATFALVDYFSMGIMSFFPFYWIVKSCFLMFLYLPQTQGSAVFFFKNGVDPLITKIDEMMTSKRVEPSSGKSKVDMNNNQMKKL